MDLASWKARRRTRPILFRADPDVDGGRWIADTRERRRKGLSRAELRAHVLAAATFGVAAGTLAFALDSDRSPPLGVGLGLVVAYAVAARVEFEIGAGSAVPTQLILVPMLFTLPLGIVPACVAAGYLLADSPLFLRGRAHPQRTLPLVGSAWYAVGPVLVLAGAGEHAPRLADWRLYLAALAAQFALDFLGSAGRDWLALGISPRAQAAEMASVWAVDAALAPIGLFVALEGVRHRYAFLATLPLIMLIGLFSRERRIRIDNALELGHAYRGTAFLLGDMIEADDSDTGAHSRDVVSLVVDVAARMGLDDRSQRNAELVALLHDVGKIRVPKEIVNKPAPLDDDEWAIVRQHTIWGEEMLKAVGGILGEVGSIVRSCHERFDGLGYPDGLRGDEIPLVARIVLACDAYSAITTDRAYRAGRPSAAAIAELRAGSGSQFDPEVVEVLAEVVGVAGELPAAERAGPPAEPLAVAG